jgi:hypothetical protein
MGTGAPSASHGPPAGAAAGTFGYVAFDTELPEPTLRDRLRRLGRGGSLRE